MKNIKMSELVAYDAVRNGELEIDADGNIWRIAIRRWNRWKGEFITTPCERHRAEHDTGAYLQVGLRMSKKSEESRRGNCGLCAYAPTNKATEKQKRAISLCIVGGETGPGARPMHLDWVRKVRDDCAAAGVPFFFKQWGEWSCIYDRDVEDPDWRKCPKAKNNSERYVNLVGGHGFHGDRVIFMRRIGRQKAGRLLDGRTHDELPWVKE